MIQRLLFIFVLNPLALWSEDKTHNATEPTVQTETIVQIEPIVQQITQMDSATAQVGNFSSTAPQVINADPNLEFSADELSETTFSIQSIELQNLTLPPISQKSATNKGKTLQAR